MSENVSGAPNVVTNEAVNEEESTIDTYTEELETKLEIMELKLEILRLERYKFNFTKILKMLNYDCPICYEKVDNSDNIVLHCGHIFHYSCVTKQRNQLCAMCREPILYSIVNI